MSRIVLASKKATQEIAQKIARKLLNEKREHAILIALQGELGAGKTTFVQSFLKACGVRRRITSPTFLIMRRYPLVHEYYSDVYHLDLYRITFSRELDVFKLPAIFENRHNIILMEWADKIKDIVPDFAHWIALLHGTHENERVISFQFDI
ncbi:MAG: tRNA (adenosine(37)-N6)-threonylcarbamoyltransferase complex ATPase subunit type 1 TsaE [Candidatus Harrisonbacteria bacterium RIFCSPLOWO2_01_FULL_40_28]|uniref:tRNA threonylcarbamoyladenosine biosynthesis protein TsaE n=2 Tax=Candidatus Harrisoniibacteriota TaxID=1817905 RepID=A0A1G1ZYP1_9BACT|nr:MAG: tRNA (adenosine(37)-N6)-threonylcarbamoyltransferase complex ATPase subunit type 1 TsaE [Candidatus Harrisonbacteria bacterium RIFCSPLOWO2_01_FULL_40_28]OGY69672.1 MAG: tRNA (adenosine(37)-N6)-threonylcarbamoyltransferase complex ATPase subunit type 1 TsaE [Candidatus Harrisonbacteria bacterium RIFOXYD1_FULL_40_9]